MVDDNIDIVDTMSTSYLDYSMSVILGRALPDVRDGLKPVHRRIIYAMSDLSIGYKSPYKKSARIVGDVIGKYHPHGDSSVYDALVRMAQDFNMGQRLIDGQGNFGSIDGDNAAAMRYTEARFTKYAMSMLHELPYNSVSFNSNYDGTLSEPEVLPAKIPNLLINGSQGIAVGMSTKIPPFNITEVINLTKAIILNPGIQLDEMLQIMPGPDFPTKGIINGSRGIRDMYETGKGSIKIRGRATIETDRKGKEYILVTELPYQTNKSKFIINVSNLVNEKIIDGITMIRDDSDRNGITIYIKIKSGHSGDIVLNNLYKHTGLETTFGVSMLCISNKVPKVMTIKEVIQEFLRFRVSVIIRTTINTLNAKRKRLHIIDALTKVVLNIDKTIGIIKKSKDDLTAIEKLIKGLKVDEIQAKAIMELRLRRLTGFEIDKLKDEHKSLTIEIKGLEDILKSGDAINNIIIQQLDEALSDFNTPRQTEIIEDTMDVNNLDLISNDPMMVTITHNGYIKRVPSENYGLQNRGGTGKTGVVVYDDDFVQNVYSCKMHDTLLLISNIGKLYWLKVYMIPQGSRVSKGKNIVNMVELSIGEHVEEVIPVNDFDISKSLCFVTEKGIVKRTTLDNYSKVRKSGIRAIKLNETDRLISAYVVTSKDKNLIIVTKKGMSIRCNISDFRCSGRDTVGVKGINLNKEDVVVGATVIQSGTDQVFTISDKGVGKKTLAKHFTLQNRSGKGIIAMNLNNKTGDLLSVCVSNGGKDIMLLTSTGNMSRIDLDKIKPTTRRTTGVKLVRLKDKNSRLVSSDLCEKLIGE